MKKTLIALAAVAATSAAFAQSTVTLYGIADVGYGATTTKDAAGATTGKTSGMVSGVQSGSRWGIKGSEDLGGGLKANFNFEQGFSVATGVTSAFDKDSGFLRRSVLELEGGFGKLGMGLDYTPSFSLVGATDVVGLDATTTAEPAVARASNMFLYTSPNMGGVTAKLGVIQQKSAVADKVSGTDLTVTYAAGPLMVGVGLANAKTVVAGVTNKKGKTTTIGGTYDMGVAKLFLNNIRAKDSLTNNKVQETNLGVSVPMGAITLLAGVGRDSVTVGGVKSSATDFTLGANYSLSKRTNVYARYAKNEAATTKAEKTTFAVGLRHAF